MVHTEYHSGQTLHLSPMIAKLFTLADVRDSPISGMCGEDPLWTGRA
jgi:hypothetical protein